MCTLFPVPLKTGYVSEPPSPIVSEMIEHERSDHCVPEEPTGILSSLCPLRLK